MSETDLEQSIQTCVCKSFQAQLSMTTRGNPILSQPAWNLYNINYEYIIKTD